MGGRGKNGAPATGAQACVRSNDDALGSSLARPRRGSARRGPLHCWGFRTLGEPEVHIKMREKFIDGVGGTNVELFLYVDLGVELSAVLPSACTNQVSWRLDATRTPSTRRLLDGVAVRICTRLTG